MISDLLFNGLRLFLDEAFMRSASNNLRLNGLRLRLRSYNWRLLVVGPCNLNWLHWLVHGVGVGTQAVDIRLLHLDGLGLHLHLLFSDLTHHLASSSAFGSTEFAKNNG